MQIKGHAIRSITSPSKPSGVYLTNVTDTTITLNWNNNSESNIASYNIHRSLDGITYEVLVTDWPTNSYTDTGLTSGQIYYYQIRSKNTLGKVSELSAVVSQETTSSGQLTWSIALPTLIEFDYGVADTFNFDPYIAGTPDSITVETGALPPNVTIVGQTLSYDGGGSTSGHVETGLTFKLNQSAELDWLLRSGQDPSNPQPGVVWFHDFRSPNEVNNFRHTGGWGNDPNAIGNSVAWANRHIMTDGIAGTGGGCLECVRPTGTAEPGAWWRPFAPIQGGTTSGNGRGVGNDDPGANGTITPRAYTYTDGGNQLQNFGYWGTYGHGDSTNSQGTALRDFPAGVWDGTEYYLQMRVKMDRRRYEGVNRTFQGGKFMILSNIFANNTNHKIVVNAAEFNNTLHPTRAFFGSYGAHGGDNPLEQTGPNGVSGWPLWGDNPNTEWGTTLDGGAVGNGFCIINVSGDARVANCYNLMEFQDQWVTWMFHVRPGIWGTYSTLYEVFVAPPGFTEFVQIWSQDTIRLYASTSYPASAPGHNAVDIAAYHNNYNMTEFYQRYTQIIFSKQWIPCPQV